MRRATLLLAALLAGCAASKLPERFHTLLAPSGAASSAAAAAPVYVDVLPVHVPAQVDHAQWVVRQGDDSLLVLEQDRWASPLPDEVRGALVERLAARWSAVDVRAVGLPLAPVWRVRVDVQRFESFPGREARIEAAWSVSLPASASPPREASAVVCRSVFVETADLGSVASLAAAHRRNVGKLADAIGEYLAPSPQPSPASGRGSGSSSSACGRGSFN
jgi:uncharacterized lipoprotein YmbA